MQGVVSEGTGTDAAIPGVAVAGKTGHRGNSRQRGLRRRLDENQAWFIGFAPADDPQIAIAATIECTEQLRRRRGGADLPRRRRTILSGE